MSAFRFLRPVPELDSEERSKRVAHPEIELTRSLELRKNVRTISILVIQVINQPETKHCQKRKDAVPRPDLLSFLLRPRQIADRHFEYSRPPLGELEDDLDLESEVITAKRNRLQKRRIDRFVTGFRIVR